MKKFRFFLLTLAMVAGVATANAQENAGGVYFNWAIGSNSLNCTGIGVKYDHLMSENFRIEPSFTYYFHNDDYNLYEASVNAHYLFHLDDMQSHFYPIFGLTTVFGKYKFTDINGNGDSNSFGRFGCNIGAGYQYDVTDDFALTAEAKYKLVYDYAQFNLSIGCLIKF